MRNWDYWSTNSHAFYIFYILGDLGHAADAEAVLGDVPHAVEDVIGPLDPLRDPFEAPHGVGGFAHGRGGLTNLSRLEEHLPKPRHPDRIPDPRHRRKCTQSRLRLVPLSQIPRGIRRIKDDGVNL